MTRGGAREILRHKSSAQALRDGGSGEIMRHRSSGQTLGHGRPTGLLRRRASVQKFRNGRSLAAFIGTDVESDRSGEILRHRPSVQKLTWGAYGNTAAQFNHTNIETWRVIENIETQIIFAGIRARECYRD